jgi:lipid II:glycine glycyltransferase (peptidoglycan interpeptide bridge formation enzyme)
MKVECFEDVDKAAWNAIVFKKGNVFQSYEWAEVMKREGYAPLFLTARRNDDICGTLLVLQDRPRRKLPGAVARLFTKFIIPTEPMAIDNEAATVESLIQAVDVEAQKRKAISTEWQMSFTRCRVKEPFLNNGYEVLEYGTHLLDLKKELSTLWSGLRSTVRNEVRRAQKAGIEVVESEDIESFHRLSYATYQRTGKSGPSHEHLNNIMSNLKSEGMCKIFCAVQNEQTLAAAFVLLCNKKMYYLYGASAENPLGAAKLLHWWTIEWGHNRDFEWYDFVGATLNPPPGSKSEGINRFKEGFGAELVRIYGGYKLYGPLRQNLIRMLKRGYAWARKPLAAVSSKLHRSPSR